MKLLAKYKEIGLCSLGGCLAALVLATLLNVSAIGPDGLILWDTTHNFLGPTGERIELPIRQMPAK